MKIAMGQTYPVLGKIDINLRVMLDQMEEYSKKGVELIIFPELSLTGYLLQGQLYNVAISSDSPEMIEICRASKELNISVMFGFVEEWKGGKIYNSAAFIKEGSIRMIQRKLLYVIPVL